MPEIAIQATGLSKVYRLYEHPGDRLRELLSPSRATYHKETWALRGLDLAVKKGESVGLLGANGAGKSTTLKLLAGKLRPTAGTIAVNGRLSSILELGTGFQPHLTGRQNALVNALFLGLLPWEADRHVDRILEFAELREHADRALSTYSSGQQARLAFAVLTTLDPDILILDEALATGDARFAAKCNDYLRALCRSGCTTLIASHDVRFLATTCDRIVWIDKGEKRAEGAPVRIVQQYLNAQDQVLEDAAGRPRYVVLRIAAEEPEKKPTFAFHAFEWFDRTGALVGEQYVGDDKIFAPLVEAAAFTGFTPQAARAGWGPSELTVGLTRSCRPDAGPGGAVYLTLPLPAPPNPVPVRLQISMQHGASTNAVFALLVDGRWVELGRMGLAGTGAWEWERKSFDVSALFKDAESPLAAAGTS